MKEKNNVNRKWLLIVISIIIIAIIVIIVVNKKENIEEYNSEEETPVANEIINYDKLPEPPEVIQKGVDGLEFDNIQIITKDGKKIWLSEVKNNSGKTTEETTVNVIFVDKDGKTIKKAEGTIPSLKKGEKSDFMIDMDFDYSKVYDFNVEAKK